MNQSIIDHPNVIAFPPVIYAVPLTAGILLQTLFPMNLLPPVGAYVLGGLSFILAGILAVSAFRKMRQVGTNVSPNQPTTAIVTDGPYRFTRNPIYLSLTLVYGSVSLVANALWPMLILPIVLILIDRGVIAREERYLEDKFGEEYMQYKARVRRWI
jgi:protein-S-isoprenylcysteine O-methyltransferase Ste14